MTPGVYYDPHEGLIYVISAPWPDGIVMMDYGHNDLVYLTHIHYYDWSRLVFLGAL